MYQGVASGDIDVHLVAWLPSTHSDSIGEVGSKVVTLGIIYDHARLAWVVPDYIPKDKLSSIKDLKNDEVRSKLSRTITGIDPGAALTRLSKKAIKQYFLDGYDLRISLGQGIVPRSSARPTTTRGSL